MPKNAYYGCAWKVKKVVLCNYETWDLHSHSDLDLSLGLDLKLDLDLESDLEYDLNL